MPFDQLIIFSTNLEPRNLVDEAFLRRIPYKIEITDPSEDEFRELFKLVAAKLGCPYRREPIDYLIEKHYRQAGPAVPLLPSPRLAAAGPQLLRSTRGSPLEITDEHLDQAVENYFAVM